MISRKKDVEKLVAYFNVLFQYLLKEAEWFYTFSSPAKTLYEYSAIPMRSTCPGPFDNKYNYEAPYYALFFSFLYPPLSLP